MTVETTTPQKEALMENATSHRRKMSLEGMEKVHQYDHDHPEGDDEGLTGAEKEMRQEELSFYSNSENEFGDDNIWGLLSGVGGNIYEW